MRVQGFVVHTAKCLVLGVAYLLRASFVSCKVYSLALREVSENQVSDQRDPQSNGKPPHPKPCYYAFSDALNPEPLNPSTGQSWPLELFSSGLAWLSPGNSAAAAALGLPMAGLMGLGLELQD